MRSRVRDVADYPQAGVTFKDISPLLADHIAFAGAVDAIVAHHGRGTIDKVVGIEARGFIVAAPVAYHFGAGFVPVRKAGKLPAATYDEDYALEYGTASIQAHQDPFTPGERGVSVDDALAPGGTAEAPAALVTRAGGQVAGVSVLIELGFLGGRKRLEAGGTYVHTLLA